MFVLSTSQILRKCLARNAHAQQNRYFGKSFLSRRFFRFSTCGWNGPDASFEKNGHKISYLALALKVGGLNGSDFFEKDLGGNYY